MSHDISEAFVVYSFVNLKAKINRVFKYIATTYETIDTIATSLNRLLFDEKQK